MEIKTYLLKHKETVIKPVHAFITFENEESYEIYPDSGDNAEGYWFDDDGIKDYSLYSIKIFL